MHLKHLSISGFRGVGLHLDLPLSHRTIIYGPNGSGKSSVLQAIAWTIYGKLPFLTGTVFSREDALVNDFLDEAQAEIALLLSDGVNLTRTRNKQTSTGRGRNPLIVSPEAEEPESAVQQRIALSLEEFFAAIFLHQETIRDFITTTPEKRSATIDRMLGTYLLRTLVKVIDPKVPAKAIEQAEEDMQRLDLQLSQAGVITREMIQQRKEEYGDPADLPKLLEGLCQGLALLGEPLRLPVPEATIAGLEAGLATFRREQLATVSALESKAGELAALSERYEQAAVTGWASVYERREQYGDPADLPSLLDVTSESLQPIAGMLQLPSPQASIDDLDSTLTLARQSQARVISKLEESVRQLATLRERYQQAANTSWESVHQRRQQYGDPATLPDNLAEVQSDLIPVAEKLELPAPQASVLDLEHTLEAARRAQPASIVELQEKIGQLDTLRERYEQISTQVVDDVSVPSELQNRQTQIQARLRRLNQELSALNGQLSRREATKQELQDLRGKLEPLSELSVQSEQLRRDLESLEAVAKQGTLYNQILATGRDFLKQAQPEHCPLCKQQLVNLDTLLEVLNEETPADLVELRQESKALSESLVRKRSQIAELERVQNRVVQLEHDLAQYPDDLEPQMAVTEHEAHVLSDQLADVQAEIAEIEGRIRQAVQHRNRLEAVLQQIAQQFGQSPGEDVAGALAQTIRDLREQAAVVQSLDLQPVAAKLDQAKHLSQIRDEEAQLQKRLDEVLLEIDEALDEPLDASVVDALDQAIQTTRQRAAEVRDIDFRPIAVQLDLAKHLSQIQDDEAQLHRRLDAVLQEVEQTLGKPPGDDVGAVLDQAIQATRNRAARIQALNLEAAADGLHRTQQLAEIQKDESRLHEFESSYQTASRQKARLSHQIQRLTDLRNALQDIAETTKQHQQKIVTEILNELDIDRFYQQLNPHPTYVQLQVEPELSKSGTYHYWIRALTDDRSRGTYVQTRFSTAQQNCAAIAIFLAVNQHLSKKLETIILDDPSQSMDPDHQKRLAQTLATIPRQVIVATEDPQMLEFLADTFDQPTIHELTPWTVQGALLAK